MRPKTVSVVTELRVAKMHVPVEIPPPSIILLYTPLILLTLEADTTVVWIVVMSVIGLRYRTECRNIVLS